MQCFENFGGAFPPPPSCAPGSHNLLCFVEARKYEVISFRLMKYRSHLARDTAIVGIMYLQNKRRFGKTLSSPYSNSKQDEQIS